MKFWHFVNVWIRNLMRIKFFNSKPSSLYNKKFKTNLELKIWNQNLPGYKFSIPDWFLTHFCLVLAYFLLKKKMEGLLSLCFCFNRWSVLVWWFPVCCGFDVGLMVFFCCSCQLTFTRLFAIKEIYSLWRFLFQSLNY